MRSLDVKSTEVNTKKVLKTRHFRELGVRFSSTLLNDKRNLLLDENYELHNRAMHISRMLEEVDIESAKVDIECAKVNIENQLKAFSDSISEKTINHAIEIFSKCGKDDYFGRTIVEEITGLKPSGASKLIKLLSESKVIIPVTGHGKGKYRFK